MDHRKLLNGKKLDCAAGKLGTEVILAHLNFKTAQINGAIHFGGTKTPHQLAQLAEGHELVLVS